MRISDGSSDVCSSDLPGQVFGSQARLFAEALGRHVVGVAPGRGLADLYQPLVDAALQVEVRQPEGDAELARETALSDMIPRLDDVQHQPGRFGLLIAVRGKGDRKSTRLNLQSLMRISYAVFCLTKKKYKK